MLLRQVRIPYTEGANKPKWHIS